MNDRKPIYDSSEAARKGAIRPRRASGAALAKRLSKPAPTPSEEAFTEARESLAELFSALRVTP